MKPNRRCPYCGQRISVTQVLSSDILHPKILCIHCGCWCPAKIPVGWFAMGMVGLFVTGLMDRLGPTWLTILLLVLMLGCLTKGYLAVELRNPDGAAKP